MIYTDSQLRKIDIEEDIFENLRIRELEFLKNEGISDSVLNEIKNSTEDLIVQYSKDNIYSVIYKGEVKKFKYPSSAAAFAYLAEFKLFDDHYEVTPGICLKGENNFHNLAHEMFHVLSQNKILKMDENKNFYRKIGVAMPKYDIDENETSEYKATGLNEGITELLASKFTGQYTDTYNLNTVVADILIGLDRDLLDAYFSKNEDDVINFFDKFEKYQNVINKNELINMSKDVIYDEDLIKKYLMSAIEYDLNFAKSKEKLDSEKERIINIVSRLDNDLYYNETGEPVYSTFVSEFLETKNFNQISI